MRKKIIGLFTAKLNDDDCLQRFELIHKYAYIRNYGVVTYYAGVEPYPDNDADILGSYYMVNFNKLDVVVIDAFRINNIGFIKAICRKADEMHVPAIVLDGHIEGEKCIFMNIEYSFEKMVTHVIEEHGRRNVHMFISEHLKNASDRYIFLYSQALKKNHIEFDENKIAYLPDDIDVIKDHLMSFDAPDMPDAIVCSNDDMAIKVCTRLKTMNINVPEQVSVVGIGGTIKGKHILPSLTTIEMDADIIIERLFDEIDAIDSTKPNKDKIELESKLCIRESCGCKSDEVIDYASMLNIVYAQKYCNDVCNRQISDLSRLLMDADSIGEISKIVLDNINRDTFLCVRDNFLQDVSLNTEDVYYPRPNDKMYVLADKRKTPGTWGTFKVKDLFPGFNKALEDNIPIIVVPFEFGHSYYGYYVVVSDIYKNACCIIDRFMLCMDGQFTKYLTERRYRYASSELHHANENVKELQSRDIMTGLYNSHGFLKKFEQLKHHCAESSEQVVLVCMDIDRFSNINDVYGHSEGDAAIQTVSKILKDSVADDCICAHIGSDEFVVVMHSKRDAEKAAQFFIKAVKERLDDYNNISDKEYSIELNWSFNDFDVDENTDLQRLLDRTLAQKRIVKLTKKNSGYDDNVNSSEIEEEYKIILDVLDNNKFKYAYQPIVSARDGEIYAYEALMRIDADRVISPLTIIKHATDIDRLYDIEKATFFNVLGQVQEFKSDIGNKKIFLNSIPGYQLDSSDYNKIKASYEEMFDDLVVEITEQVEMNDAGFNMIKRLSDKDGFEVAIDDFGSGYSNTSSLLKYLPNYVKIDRILISNIQDEPKKQHFVKNIIEFAHDNGFFALAEGVETSGELRAVIHMGVDYIQGYYTGMPKFEIIHAIPDEIRHEIIEANLTGHASSRKKMYVVGREKELFLMRLALESYTGIVVSSTDLTIVGNPDFSAGVMIKVRDGCKCRLTIRNVRLTSEDELPCIQLGKNAELTLVIEGNNELLVQGILVPESSKLIVEGDGNLKIAVTGKESFGIGNRWDSSMGAVIIKLSGILDIQTDGDRSIGIGAGQVADPNGIEIDAGKIIANVAGSDAICIGTVKKSCKIMVSECDMELGMRVAMGVGIGCFEAPYDVTIKYSQFVLSASGNKLAGIGSINDNAGKVSITSSRVSENINGRCVYLIGAPAGRCDVEANNARIELLGEGNECVGIGTSSDEGYLEIKRIGLFVTLHTANPKHLGAKEENLLLESVEKFFDKEII